MLSLFCPNPVQNNENVQPLFMYTAHNDTYFAIWQLWVDFWETVEERWWIIFRMT